MYLTPRQRRFVDNMASEEFRSNTQACIAAGYSKSGASVTASRVRVLPKIVEAIEQAKKAIKDKLIEAQTDKRSIEELRLSKLEQEVGILEAKRLALQPDTDMEDAKTTYEAWAHTLQHVFNLGHSTAAADTEHRLAGLADEVEGWLVKGQATRG